MSDHDRGYNGDAPLAFDARRPVRGGAPVPMTLIISGMVLLVLLAAVFFVYRGGLRPADGAPRPVGVAVNDIKAPAPAEAQPANPAQGLQIYHAEAGQAPPVAVQPTFAPAPEQPQARPAPRPVVAAAAPAPVTVAALKPAQAAAPTPAPPRPTAMIAVSQATPAAAAKPLVGGTSVQIGAFSSTAAADKGWSDAARVAPGASMGKGKRVETVAAPDGKSLYRTLMTGFGSRQEAQAFCVTLAGAGKKCIVK